MKNADKPAFGHEEVMERIGGAAIRFRTHRGLTKREYIATQMMAALINQTVKATSWDDVAQVAISAADALLKALEQHSPK
jgi:hypothetical protein